MPSNQPGRRRAVTPGMVIALLLGLILLTIGVIGVIAAFVQRSGVQALAGGVTTTGSVESVQQTATKGTANVIYTAVIAFTAADGRKVTFQGPPELSAPALHSSVRVSYDPANPTDARDLSSTGWMTWLGIGIVGLILGLVLVGIFIGLRRRYRLKPPDLPLGLRPA